MDDPVPVSLRVARVVAPVFGVGPGRRIGVWVQGCTLGCEGCVSPSLWPKFGGANVDAFALAEALIDLARRDTLEGITVSGGEPFEQYEALMALALHARRAGGLGTRVYTGFTLEELEARHPDRAYAGVLESLVDGRYVAELHDDAGWRGSTNQRAFQLVDRRAVEIAGAPSREITVSLTAGGDVLLAGIPGRGTLDAIVRDLGAAGVRGRFG